MIQNVLIKDSLLKKKHVAISYHKSRECIAAGIAHPMKTKGKHNFADVFTKGQTHKDFTGTGQCCGVRHHGNQQQLDWWYYNRQQP